MPERYDKDSIQNINQVQDMINVIEIEKNEQMDDITKNLHSSH